MKITGIKYIDTMVLISPLLLVPLFTFFTNVYSTTSTTNDTTEYLRPQFHLTPPTGWMNDPNGLVYDRKEKLWHVYYQYNPDHSFWNAPVSWGHSTSKDLLTWDFQGQALVSDKENESIFSGSAVVDRNNTSGFFNESIDPEQRFVAIYTYQTDLETQDIAYSLDGGYTYIKYENNPVINVNSSQQRDPKVFWHDETQKWILIIAKSQEFKAQIYASPDLKTWDLQSNFTLSGYLGYQYECPGLVKLPIDNPLNESVTEKWVLTLAINPGSPMGGSIDQYFIGDFDGVTFHADDSATRFMDIGKDFYAFQDFSNVDPEDGVLGLAWASNWQYGNFVPTDPWRSSMSLVRNYTLRYVDVNPETQLLSLISTPVFETKETRLNESVKTIETLHQYDASDIDFDSSSNLRTDFNTERNSTGVFDFNLTFTVTDLKLAAANGTSTFGIYINSQNVKGSQETIQIVFDAITSTWYIDRTTQNAFQRESPIFQERISTYVQYLESNSEGNVYQIYGFVDRNILELYFNDGSIAMTNLFFFSENKVPSSIEVTTGIELSFMNIDELVIRELGKK